MKLNLILIGIINETLDENNNTIAINGTIHAYVSTKLSGILATQMNLPYSALSYIPWFNNYSNSPFGPQPDPEVGWDAILWAILWCIPGVNIVLYVMMAICPSIFMINLLDLLAEIFMNLLSFLAWLLWVIIRCALIILSYIMLAIELIMNTAIYLALGVSLMLVSALSNDMECEWSVNWAIPYGVNTQMGHLELELFDRTIVISSSITWSYWEFFDMYFPLPDVNVNSTIFSDLEDLTKNAEIANRTPNLHCSFTQTDDYIYQFSTIFTDANKEGPNYVKLYLISPSGVSHDFDMDISQDGNYSISWWENQKIEDWVEDYDGQNEYFDYDENSEDFDPPDVWSFGVNYTLEVDFSDSQEFNQNDLDGQWFYYYKTQDSKTSDIMTWPVDYLGYYMQPGPRINDGDLRAYLAYSYIDTTKAWDDETIQFNTTTFRDSSESGPDTINLIIITSDLNRHSFEMTLYNNYTYENEPEVSFFYNKVYEEFSVKVNLSLNFEFAEDTNLFYYFDAQFSDGDHSILWNYVEDDYTNIFEGLFGPVYILTLTDGGNLEIKDYYLDISKNSQPFTLFSLKGDGIIPINSEDILRFYVGIAGDMTYEEIFEYYDEIVVPKLTLTDNPSNPTDTRTVQLELFYYEHCDGIDWYFIDIHRECAAYNWEGEPGELGNDSFSVWFTNFGPGAWNIKLEVTDPRSSSTDTVSLDTILFHQGSIRSYESASFNGPAIATSSKEVSEAGIWVKVVEVIVLSVAAILAQFKGYYELAARVIAGVVIIADVIMMFVGLAYFIEKGDAGALLGCAVHGFISLLGNFIALGISAMTTKVVSGIKGIIGISEQGLDMGLQPWKKVTSVGQKIIGIVLSVFYMVYLVLTTLCNPLQAIFTIPTIASIICTYFFSGKAKFFIGVTVLMSLLNFLIPLICSLSCGGESIFLSEEFDIIPDDWESFIRTGPMSVISLIMSSFAFGGLLGILSLLNTKNSGTDKEKSSKHFLVSYLTIHTCFVLFSSITYILAYMTLTQSWFVLDRMLN